MSGAAVVAVANERVKLKAAYLNAAAGAFLTAGVVAPFAATVFGLAGPSAGLPTLTLAAGVTIFLIASVAFHVAARYVPKGLRA